MASYCLDCGIEISVHDVMVDLCHRDTRDCWCYMYTTRYWLGKETYPISSNHTRSKTVYLPDFERIAI